MTAPRCPASPSSRPTSTTTRRHPASSATQRPGPVKSHRRARGRRPTHTAARRPSSTTSRLHLVRGEMVGLVGPRASARRARERDPRLRARDGGDIVVNDTRPITAPESWGGRATVVPQDVVVLDATLREERRVRPRRRGHRRRAGRGGPAARPPRGARRRAAGGARHPARRPRRPHLRRPAPASRGRPLYFDTDVLVLDESTAGLDAETEHLLLDTLDELKRDRIVLVVSHHQQVMDRCDRLVMIECGRIVASDPADG